jgi:hypothetical protein
MLAAVKRCPARRSNHARPLAGYSPNAGNGCIPHAHALRRRQTRYLLNPARWTRGARPSIFLAKPSYYAAILSSASVFSGCIIFAPRYPIPALADGTSWLCRRRRPSGPPPRCPPPCLKFDESLGERKLAQRAALSTIDGGALTGALSTKVGGEREAR